MLKVKRPVGRPPTITAPRETILAHAARMFATHGFENTSLSEVAKATGISKAALYHYFPAKQEIYDAIVVEMLQNMERYVTARMNPSGNFPERMRGFMVAHADFFQDNYEEFVTLLHGLSGNSRVRSAEEIAARDQYEGVFRRLLADGVSSGEIRHVDVASTSRAILAMLNAMPRWFNPNGTKRASKFAEEFYELFFEGLRPR